MADTKLTGLTALTAPVLADYLYIVDVSDNTDDSAGSSRKILLSDIANLLTPAPPRGHIDGLILAFVSTTSFSCAAGQAADTTNATLMNLAASKTKTTSAWAVGSGLGGLDTGAIAATTWYHVWLIRRSDTGVVDVLFSTSATAPTMPTNYDQKRRIGSLLTNGSSQFVNFSQLGDEFLWITPVLDVSVTNLTTSSSTYTLASVPTGVAVWAFITGNGSNASAGIDVYVRSLEQTDSATSSTFSSFSNVTAGSSNGTQFSCLIRTNTSGQIAARAQAASTTLRIITRGWRDDRGRNAA